MGNPAGGKYALIAVLTFIAASTAVFTIRIPIINAGNPRRRGSWIRKKAISATFLHSPISCGILQRPLPARQPKKDWKTSSGSKSRLADLPLKDKTL
jgi:hypothetical protein